ncbi:MAG: hypothetical protein ACETWK_07875 [Candidatus Aminicenantaceae bacterium]
MNSNRKLSVNLASNPLQNRRFYYLLTGFTGIILILVVIVAINIFINYRLKNRDVKESIANTEQKIRIAQRKEREFTDSITEAAKRYKGQVDLINGIILRKSFSWVKVFTNLEKSLPDSSYIVSLSPNLISDSIMEMRFKVVSQNLNDLLRFINNLKALKFNKIRVESENRDERGLLLSEISLSYERNV